MSPDQVAAVIMMGLLLVMVICGIHLGYLSGCGSICYSAGFGGISVHRLS